MTDKSTTSQRRVGKAMALSLGVCGLVGLALLDPLGITPAHRQRGSSIVNHVVMYQFKDGVSTGTIDAACERMTTLIDDSVHPYTGKPYIVNIDDGIPSDSPQNGHTHMFVVQFENSDERDYFLQHDPAHAEFQRDIKPLIARVDVW
ncbi:hypothetical protein OQA88_5310 [Cercophora sp. LCS_1]